MCLISVITVCYNAQNEISRTIDSVAKQTFHDFEYIIVDGLSSDSTVSVAKDFSNSFKAKGINYKIFSEKDTGIYNAMNKATDLASGKWFLFMNAGDVFYDESALDKMQKFLNESEAIIYGDCVYSYVDRYKVVRAKELADLRSGMVFCHQSTFIRNDIMKKYRYDESLKIAGDYDFFIRCYIGGEKFSHRDVIVSIFELGGASSAAKAHMVEQLTVQNKYGFLPDQEYEKEIKKISNCSIKNIIVSVLTAVIPEKLLLVIKQRKYEKMGYSKRIE